MRLSDRDRKLLWGLAFLRCSKCELLLVEPATPLDRESVIGDEAHIIAKSPNGPRGRAGDRSNLDSYENAILLCKLHHRIVDDQPETYTVNVLRDMKSDHEAKMRLSLTQAEQRDAEQAAAAVVDFVHHDIENERRLALSKFGPLNWSPPRNANGPEVVLRCAVALPGAVQLGPAALAREQITRLHAEVREDLIVNTLNGSEFTRRMRALQPAWHWVSDEGWQVLGGAGNRELTHLEVDFEWPSYRLRQPVTIACNVLTGTVQEFDQVADYPAGIVVAVDIALNVLELDADRHPANIAHRTTPPPAPAALTLAELANLLDMLVTIAEPAKTLASSLIRGTPSHGRTGMWVSLHGVELERVVQLGHIQRLSGALRVSRRENQTVWPISKTTEAEAEGPSFVIEFLEGLLEASDYRRFRDTVRAAVQHE